MSNIDYNVITNDNGIIIKPKLSDIIICLVSIAIKVIPSLIKTIKNFINSEGINTFELTILSDNDLPVENTMSETALTRWEDYIRWWINFKCDKSFTRTKSYCLYLNF